MKPLRVYIDTPVFGGYFDQEFERDSIAFLGIVRGKTILPVVSEMVMNEAARAPDRGQELPASIVRDDAEVLLAAQEAIELQ